MKRFFDYLLWLLAMALLAFSLLSCQELVDDEEVAGVAPLVEEENFLQLYDQLYDDDTPAPSARNAKNSSTLIKKIAFKDGLVLLPSHDKTKAGYTFRGWKALDSERVYKPGEVFKQKEAGKDSALYAHWEKILFTVGGESVANIDTFEFGEGEYKVSGKISESDFRALLEKSAAAKGKISLDFGSATGESFSLESPVKNRYTNEWLTLAGVDKSKSDSKNDKLVAITLPSALKNIPTSAFYKCTALKSVKTNGVKVIEDGAFSYTENLKELDLTGVETFNGRPFIESGLESLVIPASLKKYDSNVLESFFSGSRIKEFSVKEGHATLKAIDGVLYSRDGLQLVAFPPERTGDYKVPAETTKVYNWVFSGSKLSAVQIKSGIESEHTFEKFNGTVTRE